MFKFINNCFEYAYLVPQLETIEKGSLLDVIEIKLELFCASMDEKYKNKANPNEADLSELDKWEKAILLKDIIIQYKQLKRNANTDEEQLIDLKTEIIKLLFEII